MFKILDRYIIKTFFGPFFFIFSVLFFIFLVNIIWIQMDQLMGKGLTYWQITKFLFYTGVAVVSLVLPLTILLTSIMTFGDLGERYETAAMKAAGIPLTRIMRPLFFVTCVLSFVLFLFSNNLVPDFQRKAKNMLFNIAQTKPALNFTEGEFIDQIPGYLIKFDKLEGENRDKITGIFIHKKAYSHQDNQTIVAQKGALIPQANSHYLKLELYNGYVNEDAFATKSYKARVKQADQAVKFDTLVHHFDISELIEKAIEKENITDNYTFQNYWELNKTIEDTKKDNKIFFDSKANEVLSQTNPMITEVDKKISIVDKNETSKFPSYSSLKDEQKKMVIKNTHHRLEFLSKAVDEKNKEMKGTIKSYSKMILYQQKIIAYSFTCIIFFLIGSSLGSIIRKGGLGVPVIIAIVFFIIFFVLSLGIDNIAWKGKINPYLAAWLPNIILFPIGLWMTFKAMADSPLFDAEKYKAMVKPITRIFVKNKEHKRYQ